MPALTQWTFGVSTVVWNLCASLGLSLLLPRWRTSIPSSHDISSRKKGKRRFFLTVLAFNWRKVIPGSLHCRRSLSLRRPVSMPVTSTVLGSRWLATTVMSHPRGQAHCHLIENRVCGYLWWSYHKRNPHGPSLSLMVLLLPTPFSAPFHPTHVTMGATSKASGSSWTLAHGVL